MTQTDVQFVIATISDSAWHMRTLRAVRELGLPDWAIGAGFVRNAVWDRLHGFRKPTPLSDIDVLFCDPSDASKAREAKIEAALALALPDRPWSVRNQARMHIRKSDRPYASTADAMSFWLETPTCVAVHLDHRDVITVIAPYGLSDLIGMRGAPTQRGRENFDQYMERMKSKNWPRIWPKVRVEGLPKNGSQ